MWLKNEQQGDVEKLRQIVWRRALAQMQDCRFSEREGFFFSFIFIFWGDACTSMHAELGFFSGENLYVW